jgi:hypothetical protein
MCGLESALLQRLDRISHSLETPTCLVMIEHAGLLRTNQDGRSPLFRGLHTRAAIRLITMFWYGNKVINVNMSAQLWPLEF